MGSQTARVRTSKSSLTAVRSTGPRSTRTPEEIHASRSAAAKKAAATRAARASTRPQLGNFAAPRSTHSPSAERVQRLLHPSLLYTDYAENRRSVAEDLATRLKGNKDFQSLANEARVTPDEMTYRFLGGWFDARSTGQVGALQLAARDEFKLTGTPRNFSKVPDKAEEVYAAHPGAFRSFVRAQYDATQEMFRREGITHVTLYRGLGNNATRLPRNVNLDGAPHEITTTMRPLSSFTVRESLAQSYANNYRGRGILMSADVPVTRILSTPITGLGFEDQGEVIVLGGKQRVSYTAYH
jgi:hypothetical protein